MHTINENKIETLIPFLAQYPDLPAELNPNDLWPQAEANPPQERTLRVEEQREGEHLQGPASSPSEFVVQYPEADSFCEQMSYDCHAG